jgi:hypothetical protein
LISCGGRYLRWGGGRSGASEIGGRKRDWRRMFSIIMCSVDDSRFDRCRAHLAQVMGDEPHEVIRIKDAPSMCEGYNRGVAQARGDRLIFCHDDMEFLVPNISRKLSRVLAEYDVIGVAGTNRLISAKWFAAGSAHIFGAVTYPYEGGRFVMVIYGAPRRVVPHIQALDGLFIACRRKVAEHIRWDAGTFSAFHLYDLDWSFRAYQAGYKLAVVLDLPILHQSMGSFEDRLWNSAADAFLKKHQGVLAQGTVREQAYGAVVLTSKSDIFETANAICLNIDGAPL